MPEERSRLIYFRVSPEEEAKLERMRRGSRRVSIQNTLEALIATADENAPEWHIVPQPQEAANADAIPEPR